MDIYIYTHKSRIGGIKTNEVNGYQYADDLEIYPSLCFSDLI